MSFQEPHGQVCAHFHVEKGWLQSAIQRAVSQAAAISRFAEKMEKLWPLRLLLPELVKRLQDCQQVELVPLLSLDYVKRGRAKQLYSAGFKTVSDVARATPAQLASRIDSLPFRQAAKIVHSAKVLIRDEIEAKFEELETQTGVSREDFFSRIAV